MRVLLDTNFLIDLIRFKIDITAINELVGYHKLATISSVVTELERIARQNTKSSSYAKLALKLIDENRIEIIKSDRRPDEIILDMTGKDSMAATNDMELRKKLKAANVKSIYLKSKKHLAIG